MLELGFGAAVAQPVLAGWKNLQSLDLDGTGDFVDTNYSNADLQALQRDDFSFSMWIRAPYNASFMLFGHSDSSNVLAGSFELSFIYLNSSVQALQATGQSSGGSWSQVFVLNNALFASGSANNWVHVAYVVTKGADASTYGTHVLYLNGSSVGSEATQRGDYQEATVVTSGHNGLAFGADMGYSSAAGNVTGQIDECAIWNVALDADAVTAIYNSGAPIDLTKDFGNYDNSSSLQRYYRFEGSSQSDMQKDYSGEEVDASLEGNPTASSEIPS